jgi:hypothetical protein
MTGLAVYMELGKGRTVEQVCDILQCVAYDIKDTEEGITKVVLYGDIADIAVSLENVEIPYKVGINREE